MHLSNLWGENGEGGISQKNWNFEKKDSNLLYRVHRSYSDQKYPLPHKGGIRECLNRMALPITTSITLTKEDSIKFACEEYATVKNIGLLLYLHDLQFVARKRVGHIDFQLILLFASCDSTPFYICAIFFSINTKIDWADGQQAFFKFNFIWLMLYSLLRVAWNDLSKKEKKATDNVEI